MTRHLVVLALGVAACTPPGTPEDRILLVTTHSVEDSGVLEVLTAAFHDAEPGLRLTTTSVGSGAALELGRRGDGDVLLTHDPEGEARFMEEGHGYEQGPVMGSTFLVAGPASDPAGVAGTSDAVAALRRIAQAEARFLSRGDDSGTHAKERALWRRVGLEPWSDRPAWYIESGLGMAETLHTGTQLGTYLLTDEATFRQLAAVVRLVPMVRSDPLLANPYAYTLPRRQRNAEGARRFVDWLTGPGQDVIAGYGADRPGGPLFVPASGRSGAAGPPGNR